MFFNSKKRIAIKIADAILNMLRPLFIFTEYLDENNTFIPPHGFGEDHYIIGFIAEMMSLFIQLEFKGDKMSVEKKGHIVLNTIIKVCNHSDEGRKFKENYLKNAKASIPNKEFLRGRDEAFAMYGIVTGRLTLEELEPRLKKAVGNLSLFEKSLDELHTILGTGGSSNDGSLSIAITEVTINKHVNENYL